MVIVKAGKSSAALVIAVGLIVAAGVWWLRSSMSPAADARQIVLISIDTCRADYLSCYGHADKTTPNIDALAAEGILFENVITPIPQTLPAHSSMLTGTIPPYHGVHDNSGFQFATFNVTLAEILRDAGYATGAVVSASVLDSSFGIDQGFDTYHDRMESSVAGHIVAETKGGKTTRHALDWLENHKDESFFFFLHYFDPHAAYEPPEPFASSFASNPYAGEIAFTDHCVGRIVDKLKRLGLYDSTLIIITADHGEMLGEHGEPEHKYFIYQAAIKVPLIFKLPGHHKPRRVKSIVGLIDILPTVCSYLSIEIPKNVQGIDLSAGFQGKDIPVQDRHLFCESLWATMYGANSLLGIVNDRYKYIQTTRPELYDLIENAAESKNLVEEQQHRALVMQEQLAEMLEQSARPNDVGGESSIDAQTIERIQSLGYVGGTVVEDFEFDQIKDDPKDVLEYHLLNDQSAHYFLSGDFANAGMIAEQMIQQRSDCYVGYERLGSSALAQGDPSQAVVNLNRAIEIAPATAAAADIYNNRGLAYAGQGDLERAMDDFEQAISLDPSYAKGFNNRGILHLKNNDYDGAIRDFDRAIDLDPGYAQAYKNRGVAHKQIGNDDQAIRDRDRAIELNSGNADVDLRR